MRWARGQREWLKPNALDDSRTPLRIRLGALTGNFLLAALPTRTRMRILQRGVNLRFITLGGLYSLPYVTSKFPTNGGNRNK